MADEATNEGGTGNAPQTGGQAPATPTQQGFSIPEGQRLIPEAEYNQYRRSHDQYKGAEPMIQAAVKAGLKTPEDIQRIADLRARGFDFDGLARSSAPKDQESENPEYLTKEQADQLFNKRDALYEHKSASSAQTTLMQSLINELAGDSANDFDKSDWSLRLKGYLAENQLFYPEGHPLASEQFRPYGESEFAKVRDHFKSVAEQRAAAMTTGVAEAASKAAKKPSQTPAGNTGGQGKTKDDGERTDRSSFDEDRRQKAQALVERRRGAGSGV